MVSVKTLSLIYLVLASTLAHASDLDKLCNLTSRIESSGRTLAIGDNGLASGEFQFHDDAWLQTSAYRKSLGKKVYDYSFSTNKAIAREYCLDYLAWIEARLKSKMGRDPMNWEIYGAFNRGVGGFAKLDYKFSRLPAHTQKSCKMIAETFGEKI